ncbi:MAG: RdgB/HAM1 family non-canonical purine NTP pyrophosphatase [Saprospiraceae bacterium]|nr:RdgB/HAM1 family non-canonical purine NTP pyrophosphatase [Saprospiraceae bacterium]
MIKLTFATGNSNKVKEVAEILGSGYHIESLIDIGAPTDLPETRGTLEGNACQKAEYVVKYFDCDCFSEDTGLEIEALKGAPGVNSARYAGLQKNPEANMDLVLKQMEGKENRQARFRTVIALIKGQETHLFEGILEGSIRKSRSGSQGFGYDPIFQPAGFDKTLAEMTAAEKNAISHRAKAVEKLIAFLKQ